MSGVFRFEVLFTIATTTDGCVTYPGLGKPFRFISVHAGFGVATKNVDGRSLQNARQGLQLRMRAKRIVKVRSVFEP